MNGWMALCAGSALLVNGVLAAVELSSAPTPSLTPLSSACAVRAATAPRIDGVLDDAIWSVAKPLGGWRRMEGQHATIGDAREAWLAWDAQHLYVAIRARIPPELIHTEAARPESGDCVRVDTRGAATGIDADGTNLNILLPYRLPMEAATVLTDDGWCAELSIPWEHLGGMPAAGQPFAINLSGSDSRHGLITWGLVSAVRDVDHFYPVVLQP